MSVTLHKFGPMMGLPDPSPFCFKLEIYLRMAGIKYVVGHGRKLKAPTNKRPFIVEEDGKLIYDSGIIIDHLEAQHGNFVDGHLTLSQRAEALAFRRLMEEHLYWIIVYSRWLDPHGAKHWKPMFQELIGVPGTLIPIIMPLAQRLIRKSLHGHGLGRHTPDAMWKMGIADIQALAYWLGQREWGMGDKPSTIDACLAGHVGQIIRQPWNNPLKEQTVKHGNLVAHLERTLDEYFP